MSSRPISRDSGPLKMWRATCDSAAMRAPAPGNFPAQSRQYSNMPPRPHAGFHLLPKCGPCREGFRRKPQRVRAGLAVAVSRHGIAQDGFDSLSIAPPHIFRHRSAFPSASAQVRRGQGVEKPRQQPPAPETRLFGQPAQNIRLRGYANRQHRVLQEHGRAASTVHADTRTGVVLQVNINVRNSPGIAPAHHFKQPGFIGKNRHAFAVVGHDGSQVFRGYVIAPHLRCFGYFRQPGFKLGNFHLHPVEVRAAGLGGFAAHGYDLSSR